MGQYPQYRHQYVINDQGEKGGECTVLHAQLSVYSACMWLNAVRGIDERK